MKNVGERGPGLVSRDESENTKTGREVSALSRSRPALSPPPTLDEVLLSLTGEEAEWAYLLGPEEFWMWWDRRQEEEK